jgi:hypothetical protein
MPILKKKALSLSDLHGCFDLSISGTSQEVWQCAAIFLVMTTGHGECSAH